MNSRLKMLFVAAMAASMLIGPTPVLAPHAEAVPSFRQLPIVRNIYRIVQRRRARRATPSVALTQYKPQHSKRVSEGTASVHPNVQQRYPNKAVIEMRYKRGELKHYENAVGKNTVEILYQPGASRYGHLLVRVGGREYDYPNTSGTRARSFVRANQFYVGSAQMYGFVFETTPEKIRQLTEAFDHAHSNNLPFHPMGGSGKDNCTSFVTKVLNEHAPELGVRRSGSATGFAASLVQHPNVKAITVYSNSAEALASKSNFKLERLER